MKKPLSIIIIACLWSCADTCAFAWYNMGVIPPLAKGEQ